MWPSKKVWKTLWTANAIYHPAKKRTLKNEFHDKQTQTSFRTSSRTTYYGSTPKFKFFEFRAFLFSPACVTFLAELCNPITRKAIELESCSTDSANLVAKIEKKIFSYWVWVILGGKSQVGVSLRHFGHLCQALGIVLMGHFLDSKFSWKLSKNPRL